GAVNLFTGTVREFTKGKRTLFLEYQAYKPMAEKKLAEIGREIEAKWGNARTAIAHRIGRLDISELAVVIAVSTPHRKDAFAASRLPMNRIKKFCRHGKKGSGKMGHNGLVAKKDGGSLKEENQLHKGYGGLKGKNKRSE